MPFFPTDVARSVVLVSVCVGQCRAVQIAESAERIDMLSGRVLVWAQKRCTRTRAPRDGAVRGQFCSGLAWDEIEMRKGGCAATMRSFAKLHWTLVINISYVNINIVKFVFAVYVKCLNVRTVEKSLSTQITYHHAKSATEPALRLSDKRNKRQEFIKVWQPVIVHNPPYMYVQ